MDRQRADQIARRLAELLVEHVDSALQDGRDYETGLGVSYYWPDIESRHRVSIFDLVYRDAETDEEKQAAGRQVVEALERRIDRAPRPSSFEDVVRSEPALMDLFRE